MSEENVKTETGEVKAETGEATSAKKVGRNEIGRIGQQRFGIHGNESIFMEEFLPELQGDKAVQTYTEMLDNDATIGGVWFAIEMLMRNTDFQIEPGGEAAIDKEAADFVESCMYDMEDTWPETLSEILSFLPYGWSYHEVVYKRRMGKTNHPMTNSKYSDGLVGWRKLPIRGQDTLIGWEYKPNSDDLIGMTQQPAPDYVKATIPLWKALHFKTRSRKNNPEGRSIFRNAYRAWYIKKRLEEIESYGMERDLAGFPVLYGPAGVDLFDPEDPEMVRLLAYAQSLVSGIRRDAMEGIVLNGGTNDAPGWRLELLASSGKRQFDTNSIIERWDKRIATTVLADFIMLGQQQVGSFALADSKTKIFALAIGAYLEVICEVFNNQAIPRLIDANGDKFKGITDYPRMTHGDIEDVDLTQLCTYIEKLVGVGLLTPDEELEKMLRRAGNLPEKLETDTPTEMQPGEDPNADPKGETPEAKSVYKVTSILDKYQGGKLTREGAADLLESIGIDPEKIEFHLSQADKSRAEREKKEQEKAAQAQKAPQKPGKAPQSRRKKKQEETPEDDEEDAKKAQEARKSLGRE